MQAPKNGFFYVIDRVTGELISAEKFAKANWASHVDMKTGRPVETEFADYSKQPQLIFPAPDGAHTWHPMSFSPDTGLVYVPARDSGMVYAIDDDFQPVVGRWNLGLDHLKASEVPPPPPDKGFLKALDPVSQTEVWSIPQSGVFNGGVLSTAGNLVFQGTADGRLVAYSADKGKKLWESGVKVSIIAPPVTYAVGGVQYLSVLLGWGGSPIIGHDTRVSPAYEYENEGRVLTFKLEGTGQIPEPARKTLELPDLPEVNSDDDIIRRGAALYHEFCAYCHGFGAISGAITPDLRHSSQDVRDGFEGIVLGGALTHNGMAGFSDLITSEDAKAIYDYVLLTAHESQP
jgi:quinohemoprotein ethanol dehydrogenase